jgi:uncharacterized protein YqgV (UPF0045/DUF77 family)
METMTPSTTEGQINKAVANYRALLEKHSRGFDSGAVQTVLGQSEFADEVFAIFRKRVEAVSNMIVRRAHVNRNRTHQQAIDATGRVQHVNSEVLATAPKGEGEEVDVYFFDLDYDPTVDELDREMEIRSLKPDVDALSAINEADQVFADERPNVTQWRDANGKACYVIFDRWVDERRVYVGRRDYGWGRGYRFAGVRK